MMLKEKLLEDMKNAMKDKNVVRKNVIQMVRAGILQIEKDKHIELDDDQILDVIAKESKKRKDSLADYEKSGREDLIAQINEEIEILSEYLPKPLSNEEIEKIVEEVIAKVGATSMKDMGIVMKEAKAKIGPAADGKTINEIVKAKLS
ncbi:MAG: GatB/YqeY domain-containing protein [Clostridia bacterium]|nr:GatB/YqeY domain-containing protein [Clostridia bacterium]